MSKFRVLIIDDAVATRAILAETLASDPDLAVVGAAANGRIGLAMVARVDPDIVVLDLEMPEMGGLQVLESLRLTRPKLPVVVFSAHTFRGATASLDALALGANDYVTKPSSLEGPDSGVRMIAEQLAPRLKALAARAQGWAAPTREPTRVRERIERPSPRPEVVVIGISTGGPNALAALLPAIPGDLPVPILIVQHMPRLFTEQLALRLDACSNLAVSEARDGQVVSPGQVALAPGGWHMVARKEGGEVRVATHQGPPENSCRPSADVLFRSAARAFGAATLGVVMTGMGQDGLLGAGEIHQAGGRVLAQDEPSSVVWGMPGYVVREGLADLVLPLDRLAAEITRLAEGGPKHGRHPA